MWAGIVKLPEERRRETVVGAEGWGGEFAAFGCGEFASFGRWRICSLRIAENLLEDPPGT